MCGRSRKQLVIPDSKEGIKESYQTMQEPTKEAPTGQRWDCLTIKKDNNCNGLKHIKYVKAEYL